MSLAAADNLTQRQPNPYLLRASATSSQALHPMGHYTATELKLKRAVAIGEDLSFDYEELGGFQAAFEKDGGCVISKLWPPLVTPDYTPYLAQIGDCDVVCQGFAGSNPLRFMKAYAESGLKYPVVTGWTGGDDALLKSFGDEAIGLVSCSAYSLEVETESNHRFIDGMQKNFEVVPGFYAAGLYINCQVVDAGTQDTGRRPDRQGKAHRDAARGQPERHAARPAQVRSPGQRGRQFLHPALRYRRAPNTASSSGTRSSRPTRMSASSGSGRSRNFSPIRSIRATIRR